MTKYHINGKGVAAPCRATKGNCPFGGEDSHYDSQEAAQEAADKQNETKFGLLAPTKTDNEQIYKGVTDKLNNNETLKNLHKIENYEVRKATAANEINKVVSEVIAKEYTPDINEAYAQFISKHKKDGPWEDLRRYADNKGYYAGIMSRNAEDHQREGAESSINKSADQAIKEHNEYLKNSPLSGPESRIRVLVEDKKMGKREAKKLLDGGINENAKENSRQLVASWEKANEAVLKSNVKWYSLDHGGNNSDRYTPEEREEYGRFTMYRMLNRGENVEEIKNMIEKRNK